MSRKSTQVALGGVCASLSLVFMFMTGLIPFATYALPAMAGVILIAVVMENGYPTAVLVYAAVSLLSLFIVPDKEAAIMFVAIFGYYPILKGKLEKIKFRPVEYLVKFLIFNGAATAAYLVVIFVLGMKDILEEMGPFGKYAPFFLLGLGNIMFLMYDFALSQIIVVYDKVFRPKIIKQFRS